MRCSAEGGRIHPFTQSDDALARWKARPPQGRVHAWRHAARPAASKHVLRHVCTNDCRAGGHARARASPLGPITRTDITAFVVSDGSWAGFGDWGGLRVAGWSPE